MGERIEFGHREDAKASRDKLDKDVLHERDDAREAAVVVDTDAVDDRELDELRGEAVDSLDSRNGEIGGQAELTETERRRIDFSKTTVPEARTAKASLIEYGIDDWTEFFDPTLTSSEMVSIARSTQSSGGRRIDHADTERAKRRRAAEARRREMQSAERHARCACRQGVDEACEELVERHGVEPSEVREIRTPDEKPPMITPFEWLTTDDLEEPNERGLTELPIEDRDVAILVGLATYRPWTDDGPSQHTVSQLLPYSRSWLRDRVLEWRDGEHRDLVERPAPSGDADGGEQAVADGGTSSSRWAAYGSD